MLVTLVICSIIYGIFSWNAPQLNRVIRKLTTQTLFQEEYLIFLLQFNQDFLSAEILSEQDQLDLKEMIFKRKYQYNDTNDKGRIVQYKWKSGSDQYIGKQSNNRGGFHKILRGVQYFEWNIITGTPCYEMKIQSLFDLNPRVIHFCHYFQLF